MTVSLIPGSFTVGPNPFGTRDQFHGRQFFPWTRCGGWFWDDSKALRLLCSLFLIYNATAAMTEGACPQPGGWGPLIYIKALPSARPLPPVYSSPDPVFKIRLSVVKWLRPRAPETVVLLNLLCRILCDLVKSNRVFPSVNGGMIKGLGPQSCCGS